MDWIKAHYEKCLLALTALLLFALSGVLIFKTRTFNEVFAPVTSEPAHNNKVEKVDEAELVRVQEEIQTPAKWKIEDNGTPRGPLFVTYRYIIKDEKPYNPLDPKSPPFHYIAVNGQNMPIPNRWFTENKLDLLNQNILLEDPDGDGFTTGEEWIGLDPAHPGAQSTDPNDKASHPPYTVKLRLKDWIHVTFPYIFKSYEGDPKKPATLELQLSPVSRRGSSPFVKIGDPIPGTNFKVVSFEPKKFTDANDLEKDISELKIVDTAGKEIVLIFNKPAESPNSFAVFQYLIDGTVFRVQIGQSFSLQPEADKKYKLLDIKQTEAVIQDEKANKPITVPHL